MHLSHPLLALIVVGGIWDTVWKGIGLWHAGKNRQLAWFLCILIINTVGVLPIVYLVWFQRPRVAGK